MGSCIYLLFATVLFLFLQTAIGAPSQPKEVPSLLPEEAQPKLGETSTTEAFPSSSSQPEVSNQEVSSLKPDQPLPSEETKSDVDESEKLEQPLPIEETKVIVPSVSEDSKKPEAVSESLPEVHVKGEEIPKVDEESSPSSVADFEATSVSSTTLRQREVDVMDATTAISVKYVQGIPAQPIPLPDHLAVAEHHKPSGPRHGTFRFASFEPFFQMSEAGQLGILYNSEGALARHERDSNRY